MLTLRENTASHHRRAEQHEFQREFVRGTLPRELYLRWLGQLLHIHTALEAHLDRLVAGQPRFKGVFDDTRRKVDLLRKDLAFLGAAAGQPALPAAGAMIAWLASLAESQPMALLGVLYVLEGSTNGSKFIARKVRPAYGLPADGSGTAYLDPYGDAQPARWQEFKAAMDALPLPADEVEPIVAAAQHTFDSIRELGAELLAANAAAA
jgi:heme oxygenase